MSSFRPDPQFQVRDFVRAQLLVSGSDFLSTQGLSKEDPAVDPVGPATTPSAGAEASRDADAQWTPERIESLEQAAFERGAASAREASMELARMCGVLEESAERLEVVAATSIASNRDLVLSLAIEIAEKWVAAELTRDPALFGRAVDRAIEACEGANGARIVLNPSDREILETREAERVARWADAFSLVLDEDPALEAGAFRVEAGCRTVDASFSAIRERLRDVLAEAFEADLPEIPQ